MGRVLSVGSSSMPLQMCTPLVTVLLVLVGMTHMVSAAARNHQAMVWDETGAGSGTAAAARQLSMDVPKAAKASSSGKPKTKEECSALRDISGPDILLENEDIGRKLYKNDETELAVKEICPCQMGAERSAASALCNSAEFAAALTSARSVCGGCASLEFDRPWYFSEQALACLVSWAWGEVSGMRPLLRETKLLKCMQTLHPAKYGKMTISLQYESTGKKYVSPPLSPGEGASDKPVVKIGTKPADQLKKDQKKEGELLKEIEKDTEKLQKLKEKDTKLVAEMEKKEATEPEGRKRAHGIRTEQPKITTATTQSSTTTTTQGTTVNSGGTTQGPTVVSGGTTSDKGTATDADAASGADAEKASDAHKPRLGKVLRPGEKPMQFEDDEGDEQGYGGGANKQYGFEDVGSDDEPSVVQRSRFDGDDVEEGYRSTPRKSRFDGDDVEEGYRSKLRQSRFDGDADEQEFEQAGSQSRFADDDGDEDDDK